MNIKLEISSERQRQSASTRSAKHVPSCGLESKLDELRKEISSSQGGLFPHAVLSAQHINILCAQRPTSLEQLESLIGKLKTEKYGSRIIDAIQQYDQSEQLSNGEREKKRSDERGKKRPRKSAPISVESSEEEP